MHELFMHYHALSSLTRCSPGWDSASDDRRGRANHRRPPRDCIDGKTCPRVLDTDDPEHVLVQGTRLDEQLLAEISPPSHETAVRVPRRLIAAPDLMTAEVFGRWYDEHLGSGMLRVETLAYYAADAGDFARWERGEREPDWTLRRPWLLQVHADAAAGITRRRVRIVRGPPSEYVRYECQWGYLPLIEHGEDVRILDLRDRPNSLSEIPDFGVFDDRHVVRMRYDSAGQFSRRDGGRRRCADLRGAT